MTDDPQKGNLWQTVVDEMPTYSIDRRDLLKLTAGGVVGNGVVDRTRAGAMQDSTDQADLSLEITSDTQTVVQGNEFTIDITATNHTDTTHNFDIEYNFLPSCCTSSIPTVGDFVIVDTSDNWETGELSPGSETFHVTFAGKTPPGEYTEYIIAQLGTCPDDCDLPVDVPARKSAPFEVIMEQDDPSWELTAQASTGPVQPGETFQISPVLTNDSDTASDVSTYFQAATDATAHNADYFGEEFSVVAHDDDGGQWENEGWSWTGVEPNETREPSVKLEVDASVVPDEYTFAIDAISNDEFDSPDDTATATIRVEDSAPSVQPTDLRLIQTAEHTRDSANEDLISQSALEQEDALPEWAPDTPELVAGKQTIPIFDLELSQTDVDPSQLETAIDVTISWGQSDLVDQEFTLRPPFVSSILEKPESSVLSQLENPSEIPGEDGETYPVIELPSTLSSIEITVSPHGDDMTGQTASLTGVSPVETASLHIGIVLLSDTEDGVTEYQEEAEAHRDEIERLFPASTVNTEILTDPVGVKPKLFDLVPFWDYREHHQELAWEHAREELGEDIDAVVAFAPPNLMTDGEGDQIQGLRTSDKCQLAVLVNSEIANAHTAAHELTHYFLGTYTGNTQYESADEDNASSAHMTSDIVSTNIDLLSSNNESTDNGIPLNKGPVAFDNFGIRKSYMQSSSLNEAHQDTITAQALLDNATNGDGGFTCAAGTPDEEAGSVLSVSASVTADGITTHSTRKSDILAPNPTPDGNAEATVRNANGDPIDSLSLSTAPPEVIAMEDDGDCCTSNGASAEMTIRGQIPFPEQAATIELTTSSPTNPAEKMSTSVNPVVETLRQRVAALPDAAFTSTPDTARTTLLNLLDQATAQMDNDAYAEARTTFESLRDAVTTRVRAEYDPAIGIPSQQELLAEIDDRLNRIDSLQEDSNENARDPTIGDYTNESGIVKTDGLLNAIADWRNNELGTDLLLDVTEAWRRGNQVI